MRFTQSIGFTILFIAMVAFTGPDSQAGRPPWILSPVEQIKTQTQLENRVYSLFRNVLIEKNLALDQEKLQALRVEADEALQEFSTIDTTWESETGRVSIDGVVIGQAGIGNERQFVCQFLEDKKVDRSIS